ncbi:GntR family transcriptional regulator [Kribbella solani]|uniref:GntR family transcriptional regulator n=1 Tax=Kribbella solani TaxID=236067 RepID=UPI0029A462DF|nr:GntR family transcriptional regulator [Kribbella solani]MDX3003254.1 GntR family transcriptional regulator [Kribbella solani]
MATSGKPRERTRGNITRLPSGSLRVRVYAGQDPVTKKPFYLDETVPPGPKQAKEAEQVRTKLLNQVDEGRNPKTRANVGQLIVKYFEVIDVDVQTLRAYRSKYKNHIEPLLAATPLSKLGQIGTGVEILDSFYAVLRRCRLHCDGKEFIQHRTTQPHQCDEHEGDRCSRDNPKGCRRCRRMCKPHVCKGLGDSTIRQIHWILSGALDRAVVWGWIAVNPAEHASKPGLPTPDPRPPSVEEVARILTAAWEDDEDWGAFLSTKTTTGNRRGEMCALRWSDRERREGATSVLNVRRSVFENDAGELEEKDTKTHQQRRVVLDTADDEVFDEHEARCRQRIEELGVPFDPNGYMFSPVPDGSRPLHPNLVSKRYARLVKRLGIDTDLKNHRHYNATEMIMAGYNVRSAAGRLGHSGGGTTTLRVYTAWWSEADQRAAGTTPVRLPTRPAASRPVAAKTVPEPTGEDLTPYERIAADLQGAIDAGILAPGDPLPPEKALAARYGVAPSTAHRAVALLVAAGHVTSSRGKRATVSRGDDDLETAAVIDLRPAGLV